MPRKGPVPKRKISADLIYNSVEIAKFINLVMRKGKKTLAQKIVYTSFELIKKKLKEDPIKVLTTAISNAAPQLYVKPKRVGGATYQVPVDVPEELGRRLGMRWIIETARNRKGKPMYEKLAEEIINAYNSTGETIKRKENLHKMALANRAFIHYRW